MMKELAKESKGQFKKLRKNTEKNKNSSIPIEEGKKACNKKIGETLDSK